MNILFINTLRIGDTLMSWHVVNELLAKYPQAQIDFLCFDNSRPLLSLLQGKVEFHFLNRDLIQEMNQDTSVSVFRAFDQLEIDLKPILSKKYNLVINYSNTKLSSYISSIVNTQETIGASINAQKAVNYGSKWTEYLDLKSTSEHGGLFHINEIFFKALGLQCKLPARLEETNTGVVEVKKFVTHNKKKIVLQLHSSDKKKDFPQHKINSFLIELNKYLSETEFYLLCMPGTEAQQPTLGIKNASWVACTLEGAYSLLMKSDAVISVDTSIKHLASFTPAKIVELCFGSSRPQQTGAFATDTLVISAKEYCYPCKHSKPCAREAIFCSQKINEVDLAMTISNFLDSKPIEDSQTFSYAISYLDSSNYLLQSKDSLQFREYFLTKLSWVYYLDQNLTDDIHSLIHFFVDDIAGMSFERLNQNLLFLQRELEDVFREVKVGEDVKNIIENKRFQNLQSILKNLQLELVFPRQEGIIDFTQTRFLQNQLHNLQGYLTSYRKLSEDIISEAKYYERSISKTNSI